MSPEQQIQAGPPHVWDRLPKPLKGVPAVIAGTLSTSFVTALSLTVRDWVPAHGVSMVYLLAVVAGAIAFGMRAGMITAITAFLAFNYFFLQPTYTFMIADPRDLVALIVFFVVAITTGSLAGRLREVAEQARQRSQSLEILNIFATQLSQSTRVEGIAAALAMEAGSVSAKPAILLRVTAEGLSKDNFSADVAPLSTADWQAAERCIATRRTSYSAAPGWQGQQYEFRPVIVRGAVAWLLAIHQPSSSDSIDGMLDTMVYQAAMAMERLSFEAEKNAAEKQAEAERLRSAMLSSVSHDIKTPLASIKGAVTSLRELGSKMPEESRADLLAAIEEEAERLTRFVTNILDMMRMQASPDVARDWVDLCDTMAVTVSRARKLMPHARLSLDVPKAPAVVRGDETLIEHVFLNLIENAVNFSPEGPEVRIALRQEFGGYRVEVEDDGVGIDAKDLPRIFDKFFRGDRVSTRGSGLGLTICKEVMTTLGGTIVAESPIAGARGTRIVLWFPKGSSETSAGKNA